ncbi:MAG: V-type ATPase subunit [Gemmatimonadetes bacterium]|nr:V-type ATPase subunit [Gemmatimonadota bacterium]
MTVGWEDVVARARGLEGRFLGRRRLEELAALPDEASLAEALERAGFPPVATAVAGAAPDAPRAALLDGSIRRMAAERMAVLARWAGPRVAALTVVFGDEDRRSVRAVLRGAVAGAAPEVRLAGLVPTPALPVRALEELARQPAPGGVASLLVVLRHPYGPPLWREAGRTHPDLFGMEAAVSATFAERATRGARRGGRVLREYVRELIDLENAMSALGMAGRAGDRPAAELFLSGGARLDRASFLDAVAADIGEVGGRLGVAFRRTPYAAVLAAYPANAAALERELLRLRIRRLRGLARRDPLGAAPVLLYALRLRAEVLDLRRIVWARTLGVPASWTAAELVGA